MPPNTERNLSPELGREELLGRYRKPVHGEMRQLLQGEGGDLARMFEYHLGFRNSDGLYIPDKRSDGKGTRSTLCLLTVDATSGDWQSAVPAGVAFDFFHNATLIQDDVFDKDEKRYGRPALRQIWGDSQAINTGNAAFEFSSNAMLSLAEKGHEPERVLHAMKLLTDARIQVHEGQMLDIDFERRPDISDEEYFKMIRGKTGVLVETAVAVGALLGSADDETTAHLIKYGSSMGLASQLANDYYGIWGDPTKTGMTVGGDIQRRKKSFPVIHAMNHGGEETKALLQATFTKDRELDTNDVQRVLLLLEDIGSKDETQRRIAKATDSAVEAINHANINKAKKTDYLNLTTMYSQYARE